ncbi:hypothetical protein [Streptomyces sp. NPDC001714]|uniref:hypothetical protein n=1 Tax=Streptomyces sp. NPDC001714 TaxID=3364603 RepID=UPI0036C3B784
MYGFDRFITGRRATRGHPLTAAQKEANRLDSRARAANEHGFAGPENWRLLTEVRMNARHATTLLRALLVLANAEAHRRQTITRYRSRPRPAQASQPQPTPVP